MAVFDLRSEVQRVLDSCKKSSYDDLYNYIEITVEIHCCKCTEKGFVGQSDGMEACEELFEKGWRRAYDPEDDMQNIFCPKCAKKHKIK